MTKPRVGWIGLGHMGVPMAANLLKAGYPVMVYNRTPGKTGELRADLAASPAKLAADCDIIITMLADDAAQEAVLFGADGVAAGLAAGKIVVNMGTISPEASRSAAQRLTELGVEVLDAPVSGSVKPATDGTLVILVGGEAATVARLQPLFDVLGKKTFHFGPHGQGAAAKLAINMLLGLTLEALGEAVTYGQNRGLDRTVLLDMIAETACASPIVNMKLPALKAGNYPAAFPLKHMAKDFRLALAAADKAEALPATKAVSAVYASAEAAGLGDSDIMAVIRALEA